MKNEHGVYLDYQTERIATCGRSRAEVSIAKCDDGLFRFAIGVDYSYGGFSGPITDQCEGYPTYKAAKDAGIEKLLARFPKAHESEPESVKHELKELRRQIEQGMRQPSLF